MSHTRSVAVVCLIMASSVSGCMSQAKLAYVSERVGDPNTGKPVACVISIPERTDSWPYYNVSEAKAKAEKELGGPVEEVKRDPKSTMAPKVPPVSSDGKSVLVQYRLKQPVEANRGVGMQSPGMPISRQPGNNQIMQTGGLGGMPTAGQSNVIPDYPGQRMQQPNMQQPTGGYPTMGGNQPNMSGYPALGGNQPNINSYPTGGNDGFGNQPISTPPFNGLPSR